MTKIKKRVLGTSFVLMFGLIYFLFTMPENLSESMTMNYCSILMTYIVLSGGVIYTINRFDFDIFEPILILLVMFMAIFVLRPIQDIVNNDFLTFGVNPMGACVKSNIIVCVSVIAFYIGYYRYFKVSRKLMPDTFEIDVDSIHEISSDYVFIALVIWTASFLLSLVYLLTSGKSLSYILSFGSNGFISDDASAGGAAALSFFNFSMIPAWLYIVTCGKNKIFKIFITTLMLAVFIVRGTRIVLVVMLSSLVLYYYISRQKRPKIKTIFICLIVMLVFMSVMQASRGSLRTGGEFDIEAYKEVAVTNVFDADLTTYKQFYCIVNTYPSKVDYTMGAAIILQTLITIIPRSIWPGKPEPVIYDVIINSVNERAARSGMASPGIGEYYFEFGVLGCIVCMFILGCLFKRWKRLLWNKDIHSIIRYSVLYGLAFQLIIRTSTPSCVYQYIFSVLPIFAIRKFVLNK